MIEKKVDIPSSVGILEGQIIIPEKNEPIQPFGIVLCHPHPQFGGTMANNVVRSIYKSFGKMGYPIVRFNFRGVGYSAGVYAGGVAEQEDVIAACYFLQGKTASLMNNLPILLVGYSFGSVVAASVANNLDFILGYVAISYPFTFIPDFISQAHTLKPKLFLMGSRDDFTTIKAFNAEFERFPHPKAKQIIPNIDHFWIGAENSLVEAIQIWISEQKLDKKQF